MKKQYMGFIIGFIFASILFAGTTSFANTLLKTIQVEENAINIKVNGKAVNVPNFIEDGRTYIQVRTLSEMLGKDVSYDGNSNTAYINDRSNPAPSPSVDTSSAGTTGQLTTQEIAQKGDAVLLIKAYDSRGNLIAMGSGFTVTPDGKAVTNYHVISGANSIQAETLNGFNYTAILKNSDQFRDIAILQLQGASGLPVVTLGDSGKIQLGDSVVAIGNPDGLQNVVSDGIISTTGRNLNGKIYIQTTAPISPGSSGGALFNSHGEVIGITAASITDGENLNFAVPINDAIPLINAS